MEVILYPGSRLLLKNDDVDSFYSHQKDVTRKSIRHLFDNFMIAPDVTLNDVFGLFKYCPELLHVYSDLALKKLLEKIQSNLDPEAGKANPYELGLRIYREWNYDSRCRTYFKHHNPYVKLHVRNENFGSDLAFCPIEDVLGVKLELLPHVFTMKMDRYSSRLGDIDATRKNSYFSLGELLQSLQIFRWQ